MARKHKKSGVVPKLVRIEPLEPRLLYSAEVAPWLALVDPDQRNHTHGLSYDNPIPHVSDFFAKPDFDDTQLLSSTVDSSSATVTDVVLVDSTQADIEELLKLLQSDLADNAQIAVITLAESDDPLSDIAQVLSRYDNLQAVHIVSHASDGAIQIGEHSIDSDDLISNNETVALWGESLSADGDILLYGCNLSASDDGREFAQTLSLITNADVASSSDVTGNSARSGDWDLEITEGTVEAGMVVSAQVQNDWQGGLDISTGLIHHWELEGNGNDSAGTADMVLHNNVGSPTGLIGKAGDFNEANSTMKIGEIGSWKYSAFQQTDFSIAFWMHVNSADPDAQMFGNLSPGGTGFDIYLDANDHVVFVISDGINSQQVVSTNAVADSDWRHIVASRSGDSIELRIYNKITGNIDVVSTGGSGQTISVGATHSIMAGASSFSTGDYDGMLDDIRIYDRALSATDAGELVSLVGNEQVLVNNEPVTVASTGNAPITSAELLTVDNDTADAQLVYTITADGASSALTLSGATLNLNDTFTQADINNGFVALVASPSTPDTIGFSVNDGQGSVTRAVLDVNPVATGLNSSPDTGDATATVDEDDTNYAGDTVADLIDPVFVDSDAGASLGGILVVDEPTAPGEGHWEYSTDGVNWFAIGNVSNTHALALSADTLLRFQPEPDYNGTPATQLVFHVVDDTYAPQVFTVGATRQEVATTPNGGDSAISSSTGALSVNVNPVNDAPSIQSASLAGTAEDNANPPGASVENLFVSGFADDDAGDQFSGIAISVNTIETGVKGDWQWSKDGINWQNIGIVSKASSLILERTDYIRFLPEENYHGPIAPLSMHGLDDGYNTGFSTPSSPVYISTAAPTVFGAVSINPVTLHSAVYSVNDRPELAGDSVLPGIDENNVNPTGATVASLLAGTYTDVEDGASVKGVVIVGDASINTEGTWELSFDGTNWAPLGPVSANFGLVLDANTQLRFVPAADYSGTPGSLTFWAVDSTWTGLFSTGLSLAYADVTGSVADAPVSLTTADLRASVAEVNQPPTQLTAPLGLTVNENSAEGTVVGTIVTTDSDDATHTYSLINDASGLFTIDSNSGEVTVAAGANLDFEAGVSYFIQVQSTDSASNAISTSFIITVEDINEAPAFTLPVKITPVQEDDVTNNGDLIGTLFSASFSDPDINDSITGIVVIANNSTPGTGIWQYQSVGGSWVDVGAVSRADPLVLGVNERLRYVPVANFNGNIGTLVVHAVDDSLQLSSPLVAHRDPSLFDAGGSPSTARISQFSTGLGGQVLPVNDPPHYANVSQQLSIDENSPVGTSLGTVIGHDVDDATLSYSLTGNSGGRFTINPVTGEVTVLNSAMLDYETDTFHQITVQITDSASQVFSVAFPVLVNDVSEAPHALTASASLVVVENSANGTIFGVVNGQDVDDAPLNYSLQDNANGRFAIDANTGELSVLDSSQLDFETGTQHQITIEVTDSVGLSFAKMFNIVVMDENEAPHVLVVGSPLRIVEGSPTGTSAGSVVGQDVDDTTLTYSLLNDANGRFVIDANTGALSVLDGSLLDHEANTSHQVVIEVQDAAGLGFSQAFNVDVLNKNEAPHAIGITVPLMIVENAPVGTVVGAVAGQDVDDTFLSYSLTNDAGGRFAIDSNTGEVSVLGASLLDFETNSSHQITIEVEDLAGLTHSQTFTVIVTNENEAPHAIANTTPLIVDENEVSGTSVGIVTGTDVDDTSITYSLIDNASGRFSIDANTGEVLVLDGTNLDFETNSSHQITIAVQDAAGLSYAQGFTVAVVDENEAPHAITITAPLSVVENAPAGTSAGASVGVVTGQDVDDLSLTYSLLDNAGGRFDIDASTGELLVLDSTQLDFEANASHQVTIQVQDAAGLSYDKVFTINVLDVNEAPHSIAIATPLLVVENAAAGTPAGAVAGQDVDDRSLSYSLIDDANGRFAIDASTGELSVVDSSLLDAETSTSHVVTIEVLDAGGLSYTDNLTVNVINANDAPVIDLTVLNASIQENVDTTQAFNVAQITVQDVDAGNNVLSLGGADANYFQISGNLLQLKPGVTLNNMSLSRLDVVVNVDDASVGNTPDSSAAFSLLVTAVEEAPVISALETSAVDYTENSAPVPITSTVVVSEPDTDVIALAQISITSGFAVGEDELIYVNQNGIVGEFDSTTGVLTLSGFATTADYQSAIRSIGFQNSSDNPSTNHRVIKIEVNDSISSSNTLSRMLNINPVNDEEQMVANTSTNVQLSDTVVLSNAMLAVSDADHASNDLVYSMSSGSDDINLQVNGINANSFTQQDVDLGLVSLVSVGSDSGLTSLSLSVNDGEGQSTALVFVVDVLPVPEPPPAAALPKPEPIDYVEDIVLSVAPATPVASLISFQPEQENVNNTILASAQTNVSPVSEALSTSEQVNSSEDATPLLGQASLTSLQVPDFVSTRSRLNAEVIAEALSEPRATINKVIKLDAAEQVELQMASLLSLEPLSVTEGVVFKSQGDNAGLQSSLEKLQQQFTKAAESTDGRAVARDSVIGFSLSVTAGFLVWMLRSGALLASLFSISPLWKQLDPLPILSNNCDDDLKTSDDADRVEELFSDQRKTDTRV